MNNEIKIFEHPSFGEIRTIGTAEEPMFCLSDLCKALELTTTKVVQRLEDGVLTKHPTPDILGRLQDTYFVNEDGLYDVILDSRKPEAKKFRKWVTSEVLPSIRKTGGYIQAEIEDSPEVIMAKALKVAELTLEAHKQRVQMLEGEVAIQEERVRELAPKAQYTDEVLQSTSTYTFTQIAKEIGMASATALARKLKDMKVIYRQSGQWQLYSKYCGYGYTKTRTHTFQQTDGGTGTNSITVWTEEGRMFIHGLLGN